MKHLSSFTLFRSAAAIWALGLGSSFSTNVPAATAAISSPLQADGFVGVATTQESALNDLVRRLPIISRAYEQDLAGLSAIQEMMLVHERRMRGEGLPTNLQKLFSDSYSAIVTAIVDDRITMCYGRELLDVHRQLLGRAFAWNKTPVKNADYGEVLALAINEMGEELATNAEPLATVPECVRTPAVKGHLLWIEEFFQASGCGRPFISRGRMGNLRLMAQRLERFEGYYKRDLHLTRIERENLHARLIELNRELIDTLRR
jgi:hypothetical protein